MDTQGLKLRSCATVDLVVVVACNSSQHKWGEDQLWQCLKLHGEWGRNQASALRQVQVLEKSLQPGLKSQPNIQSVAWALTHTHTSCRTQLKPSSSPKQACAALDVLDMHVVSSQSSRERRQQRMRSTFSSHCHWNFFCVVLRFECQLPLTTFHMLCHARPTPYGLLCAALETCLKFANIRTVQLIQQKCQKKNNPKRKKEKEYTKLFQSKIDRT